MASTISVVIAGIFFFGFLIVFYASVLVGIAEILDELILFVWFHFLLLNLNSFLYYVEVVYIETKSYGIGFTYVVFSLAHIFENQI